MKFQKWYDELTEQKLEVHKFVEIICAPDGYTVWGKHKYNYEEIRLLEEFMPYPEKCVVILNGNDEITDFLFVDDVNDFKVLVNMEFELYQVRVKNMLNQVEEYFSIG